MAIKILGINYGGHDTSACVMINGKLIAACEQERYDYVKHSRNFLINWNENCYIIWISNNWRWKFHSINTCINLKKFKKKNQFIVYTNFKNNYNTLIKLKIPSVYFRYNLIDKIIIKLSKFYFLDF